MNRRVFAVLLMLGLLCVIPLSGKLKESQARRLIMHYDVDTAVMSVSQNDAVAFWRKLQETNPRYQEIYKAAVNGKAKDVKAEIASTIYEASQELKKIPYMNDSTAVRLTMQMQEAGGIANEYRESDLRFIISDEENAFTTPDGQVYICMGLVTLLNADKDLLMAVYAHELAHFVLQHGFAVLYYERKKEKREKLIADIATGLYATATTAADFYANVNGVDVDWNKTFQNINRFSYQTQENAGRRVWNGVTRYTMEQEFEADIVGYNFLEFLGIGGHKYIEMLRCIDSNMEVFYNDETSHPLTKDRIELLMQIPELRYEIAEKNNKKYKWFKSAEKVDELYGL